MNNRLRAPLTLLLLPLVLVAVACSSGSESGQSSSEALVTAATGGELRSQDGSFVLSVPAGAVSEDVTISFEAISDNGDLNDIADVEGISFDLKPDGLQFIQPGTVTLTVPIEEQSFGDISGFSTFDLFSLSSGGEVSGLENISNEFDTEAGTVKITGDLSHFSTMYRIKSHVQVSLEQIEPEERAVGAGWFVESRIMNLGGSRTFDTTWEFETRQAISMTNVTALRLPLEDFSDEFEALPVDFTSSKTSSTGTHKIESQFIRLITRMKCDSAGRGIYSLRVNTRVTSTPIAANHGRAARFSFSGRVNCVTPAAATAATGSSDLATQVAGALEATPTPTPMPAPTATSLPNVDRGEEKLRLVVVAASGSSAPEANAIFNVFENPTVGGGNLMFHAFTDNSTTGIWSFEEDELIGGDLSLLIVTVSPSQNGDFAAIKSVPLPVTKSGIVGLLAREKIEDDFIDAAYLFQPDTLFKDFVSENSEAPGSQGTKFSQFNWIQVADPLKVVVNANASAQGLWTFDGEDLRLVLLMGQALPGIAADWRTSGGKPVTSVGITNDGRVAIYLDYFPAGKDTTESGIWLSGPAGVERVVQAGMAATAETGFTEIRSPSVNSDGQVAFLAHDNNILDIEFNTRRAIWKTGPSGELILVAEPGAMINDLELLEVNNPRILHDGRVMFTATAFDGTNSVINYLVVEGEGGLDIIAQTDALPGPDGQVSAVPTGIHLYSVNIHGHVAFELGFGEQIWMQSPGGFLHRAIAAGDTIDVPTSTGTATKTVSFVDYVGDTNTGVGLPSAYSDDHHLAMKVTFTDSTTAIVLATFDELPIPG